MPICVTNREIEEAICWLQVAEPSEASERQLATLKEFLRLRKRAAALRTAYTEVLTRALTAEYDLRRVANIALDMAGGVLHIDAKMDEVFEAHLGAQ